MPEVRFSMASLRAEIEEGLCTSRLKVSMPISLSSEIVLDFRAVAKTRRPGRICHLTLDRKRRVCSLIYLLNETGGREHSLYHQDCSYHGNQYEQAATGCCPYPVIRTVLLPSAILERYRSNNRTDDSPFCMKTLIQGSVCASLRPADCKRFAVNNIKERRLWTWSFSSPGLLLRRTVSLKSAY